MEEDHPVAEEDRGQVKENNMSYLSNYMPEEIYLKIFSNNEPKKAEIQFRDSSVIEIERKPCGCVANKIKQPESS